MWEWDEDKREANRRKHGVDFAQAALFDWTRARSEPDLRRDYGELRVVVTGPISNRLFVLVYAERGNLRRLISLRKANQREFDTWVDWRNSNWI